MALLFSGLTIPPAAALNRAASDAAQRQISAAGARSVVPVVYGEDRIGGLILNALPAGASSPTLLVQVLWGHALDSIADVRFNDQALPAGSTVTHYTGGQSTADAALVAAFSAQSITYTDTLAGYAYSVVAMPTRAFEGSLAITGRVRGRRLYDPRQDCTQGGSGTQRLATPSTWAWSDNPALALADWLASTVYGCSTSVDWSTVGAAANHCDALVGTPPERRRVLGLGLVTPASVAEVAESLRAHAGCWLVPGSAGIRLLPDQDAAPAATYTHNGGDIAQLEPLTIRDNSSEPTVVEILYTDTSKIPYREASASASLPGAGTTRPYRLSQVRMPGVQRFSQANREAIERLNKLTLGDLSTVVEVFDIGIRHEIGDIVAISHPVGLVAKPFRIAQPPEMVAPGRWRLPLVEHDPAVYSSVVQTQPSVPDAGFVSPAGPPGPVTGFTSASEAVGVRLRWAPNPESDVVQYQLRLGGTNWATATPLDGTAQTIVGGTTHLWPQPAAGTYTFRIRAQDLDGNLSVTDATTTITVGALAVGSQGPQGPAGASGTQTATVYLYQWASGAAPADPTTSTSWDWATAAHTGTPGNGWSTTLPANPGTAGLLLWVAQRSLTASAAATTSTVTWAPGSFTKQSITTNGAAGPQGVPGVRTGYARAFQWSLAPAPTTTGSATYTWATGAVSALPTGSGTWVAAPTASPSPGLTLWQAEVVLIDSTTVATSAVNWTTATVRAVGFAGANGAAGSPGSQGVSARVAYSLATGGVGALASTPPSVTVSGDNRPANGQWGTGTVWVVAPPAPAAGESVWVTDGLFDPALNSTTWYAPYLASLRVGQLSAISANLGTITAGSIGINGRASIAADGYAEFRGLRVLDESGNVVLSTRATGGQAVPSSWVTPAAGWLNSNVTLTGANGTITINGAGGGSATGVVMPGNPLTSGNITTYISGAAIGDAQIGNLNAGKITAGTLDAARIGAGSITARHLTLTGKSLNPDPSFLGGAERWAGFVQRLASGNAAVPAGCPAAAAAQFNARDNMSLFDPLNVLEGEEFRISCWVSGGATGAGAIGVLFYGYTAAGSITQTPVFSVAASSGWQRVSGVYRVPVGIVRIAPGAWTDRPTYTGASWFADLEVEKRTGAELVVDGSITANKLTIGTTGPGTNLIQNTNFAVDLGGWLRTEAFGTWARAAYGGAFAAFSPSGVYTGLAWKAQQVRPGQRFRVRARFGRSGGVGTGVVYYLYLAEYNAPLPAGSTHVGTSTSGGGLAAGVVERTSVSIVGWLPATSVTSGPAWDQGNVIEGIYTVPAGVAWVSPSIGQFNGTPAPDQSMIGLEVQMLELVGSVIIEDGAVTANKINIKDGATSGARVEIETNRIRVFDASNVERVRIGSLL